MELRILSLCVERGAQWADLCRHCQLYNGELWIWCRGIGLEKRTYQ